jgi:hypothetical protein
LDPIDRVLGAELTVRLTKIIEIQPVDTFYPIRIGGLHFLGGDIPDRIIIQAMATGKPDFIIIGSGPLLHPGDLEFFQDARVASGIGNEIKIGVMLNKDHVIAFGVAQDFEIEIEPGKFGDSGSVFHALFGGFHIPETRLEGAGLEGLKPGIFQRRVNIGLAGLDKTTTHYKALGHVIKKYEITGGVGISFFARKGLTEFIMGWSYCERNLTFRMIGHLKTTDVRHTEKCGTRIKKLPEKEI